MVIKLKCGQQLLIDSLIYKIETENVYENFYKEKALFNFSNYPKGSKNQLKNLDYTTQSYAK